MIKTDFIKLYEELDSLNEDEQKSNDVVTSAELADELDALNKNINELDSKVRSLRADARYSSKIATDFYNTDEEIQKLEHEKYELEEELEKIKEQFGEWKTYVRYIRTGPDDYDKDVESEFVVNNKEKEQELKPRIEELEAKIKELSNKIWDLKQAYADKIKLKQKELGDEADLVAKDSKVAKDKRKQRLADIVNQLGVHDVISALESIGITEYSIPDDSKWFIINREKNELTIYLLRYITVDAYDHEDSIWADNQTGQGDFDSVAENIAEDTNVEIDEKLTDADWPLVDGKYEIPDSNWKVVDEYDTYEVVDNGNLPSRSIDSSPATYWDPGYSEVEIEPDTFEVLVTLPIVIKLA